MAKEYSHNEILRMQQDAMHRVQEMQARAQRTLDTANARSAQQPKHPPAPREMEERIQKNDAPRPQQNMGQQSQHSTRHTRLPVEFSRPINTQGVPPYGNQNQRQHPPEPDSEMRHKPPVEQEAPKAPPPPEAHHREEPRRTPPMQQRQQRQQQRPQMNRNVPMHHPSGPMGNTSGKPRSGLAGLFGSSGDFIKNLMADKDLMMVLGMVWLLSGEESADQSLIMSLLYIIM